MATPEEAHFLITQAKDWPMFQFMFTLLGAVFIFMWGLIAGLIAAMWRSLSSQVEKQKQESDARLEELKQETEGDCTKCKGGVSQDLQEIWNHIDDVIWKAIETCCPRSTAATPRRKSS